MTPSIDILLLAAGLGTRLRPLTLDRPKPLLSVGRGCPIEYHLELLQRHGVRRVIINLHYLGEQIREFVGDGSRWQLEVRWSEELPVILDTGGAVKNIERLLEHDTLVTINADLLIEPHFSLQDFVEAHHRAKTPITALVAPQVEGYTPVGVDLHGRVVELFHFRRTLPSALCSFVGIQALEREVLSAMPPAGSVFSLTRDTWLQLLNSGKNIQTVLFGGYWKDIGSPTKLTEAREDAIRIFGIP